MSKEPAAPLNHLWHNGSVHTIHKSQQRKMHGKLELNRLQQMKTSHFVIDCYAPPNSRHKSSERCCFTKLSDKWPDKGRRKTFLEKKLEKGRDAMRCGEFLLQRRQFLRKTNSENKQWLRFFCTVA